MGYKPEGSATIVPYINVDDPAAAIDFYRRAFGATEVMRLMMGDRIGHAEIDIGDGRVMLSGEWPEMGRRGPKALGGTSMALTVFVPDVDAAFQRAVDAGATPDFPPSDQFYGDRAGMLTDPFGHRWSLHTHQRDVPMAEMQAAMDQMAAGQGGQ